MKKYGSFLVCAALLLACLGLLAAWRESLRSAADLKAEVRRMQAALQETRMAETEDPIAAFFDPLPYSSGTVRFLAVLAAEAYQCEARRAAVMLEEAGEDAAFLDAFLEFTEAQAQSASDQWAESLEAQGPSTAGAWAHTEEARIPFYRFAAFSLIAQCQRKELAYEFQFSPDETRQILLENGFPEDFFAD